MFAGLPAPAVASAAGARCGRCGGGGDPLLALAPASYVEALLGRPVGRDGKIACPFHPDVQSSMHVYPKPDQGWYCFSCLRGGSVYDLAGALWLSGQSASKGGRALRGREFIEVRERLLDMFGRGGIERGIER